MNNRSIPTRKMPDSLEGVQFTLKPFTVEDISDRYIAWLNDPEVNRFLEVRFTHQTHETVTKFVRAFYDEEEKYIWGIYPNQSSEPVGTITLFNVNRNHRTGGIGLMIGESGYRSKGASTAAMELLLEFAFETLGLRRATGGSYAINHGVNFTLKRLGFNLEGKFKNSLLTSPEAYTDEFRWGILADEWRARRQSSPDNRD